MTDSTPSRSSVVYGAFNGSHSSPTPHNPADADALGDPLQSPQRGSTPADSLPTALSPPPSSAAPPDDAHPKKKGAVQLDAGVLRELRESLILSQEEMANLFVLRNIRISIATIKRAETCHQVRYRIAREFARFFRVPVETLLKR